MRMNTTGELELRCYFTFGRLECSRPSPGTVFYCMAYCVFEKYMNGWVNWSVQQNS